MAGEQGMAVHEAEMVLKKVAAATNGDHVSPSALPPAKKPRMSHGSLAVCQIPGCATPDLANAPTYNLRHRICVTHFKAETIEMADSTMRRWCHQCGRLQDVVDFSGVQRSCRETLLAKADRRHMLKTAMKKAEIAAAAKEERMRELSKEAEGRAIEAYLAGVSTQVLGRVAGMAQNLPLPGALGAAINPAPAGLLGIPGYEAIVAANEAAVRASMVAGLGTNGGSQVSIAPTSVSASNFASAAAAAAAAAAVHGGSLQNAVQVVGGDGGGVVDINAAVLLQGAQPPPGKWKLLMVPCDDEAAANAGSPPAPPDTAAAQAAVSAGAGMGLGQDGAAASAGLQLGSMYNHIIPGQGIDVGTILSRPGAVNSLPQWLQAQLSNPHQGIGASASHGELSGLARVAGADQGDAAH